MATRAEIEAYIRQSAAKRGIDPEYAVRVAKAEGGFDPNRQSGVTKNGVREPSYGPFQLLVGGGDTGFPAGLGNDFVEKYGMHPSNPEAWDEGIDFALDTAAKDGWRQWYGAKNNGIGRFDGIGSGAKSLGTTLTSRPGGANAVRNAAASDPAVSVASGAPAPALPAPIDVGSPAVAAANATTPIGDKIGGAVFGDELAGKLKGLFGEGSDPTNPAAKGLGLLTGAFGGNQQAQAQQDQPIQSSLPAEAAADASRMAAAQQLMSTLLANKKRPRGLTLNSGVV